MGTWDLFFCSQALYKESGPGVGVENNVKKKRNRFPVSRKEKKDKTHLVSKQSQAGGDCKVGRKAKRKMERKTRAVGDGKHSRKS